MFVDYVKKFRTNDTAEDDENAEVPGMIAVVAEALGVAHADPETEKDSECHEESVGRKEKTPDMKKLREHV